MVEGEQMTEVARHSIVVTRGEDGHVEDITFVCHGDASAQCRNYPDCDCETWIRGQHEHPDVPQADCWREPWLNACLDQVWDWLEANDGDDLESDQDADQDGSLYYPRLVSGDVDTTFEDEYMTWRYLPALDGERDA